MLKMPMQCYVDKPKMLSKTTISDTKTHFPYLHLKK